MDANAYAREFQQLLPRGAAWNLEPGSTLTRLLLGLADEYARVDDRAKVLVDEWDPRTTLELLADWERVYGLPDPCVGSDPSVVQRRNSLVAQIINLGGQTPAYFIAVAAALGFTVTITEFDEYSVEDDVDAFINGPAWAYAWQVNAPLNTVFEMTVDDLVSDPIASWGNEVLECVLERIKPAHTDVLFSYS